ncbi:MAG: carbohydrate kinase [Granulosicoccus sp.]|nr:carbohydrate kinase [Granulosicoccus sp.]
MFISCGDILVDLFNQPTDAAGKVALQGHVGGSPLNVAIGLARLGNESGYLCKNSTDFIGQKISAYMQFNGLRMEWVVPSTLNSTLAMVRTNDDGSANYTFYTDNTADVSMTIEDLPDSFPDNLEMLHFASYSTAVGSTRGALIALAERESGKRAISYDPNLRTSIEPDIQIWQESFASFCAVADFVKASDEDIAALLGKGKSLDTFAADTLARGPGLVAVTEGSGGATLYAADGRQARSRPLDITVVDTVGAGDTFQAASLHWLNANGCVNGGTVDVSNADLHACVNFAATAAAITCTRHGADLPTLSEVQSRLSGAS